MEMRVSRPIAGIAQRIVVIFLLLVIAVLAIFVVRTAFFGSKSETPRTALERSYIDALAVVKKDPRSAQARMKLAMTYALAGRYDDALSELDIAVKLDPKDPEIYYTLGFVYKKAGDPNRAIEALNRAVKKEGGFADVRREAYYDLGQIYYEQKKYPEAVQAFENSASYGPEATYVLLALAGAYEKAGMKSKAIEEYREILQFLPGYAPAKKALERLSKTPQEK